MCALTQLGVSQAASSTKKPAEIEADSMNYDQKTLKVIASGNVEVKQDGRLLKADSITYDKKTNVITADGNVSILNPDGNVFFADSIELTDDMKRGVVENFRSKFIDESRIKASKAKKLSAAIIELLDVSYSPCPVCVDNKEQKPLWSLTAKKAEIDNDKQRVAYNHAFFRVKDVPILYTPYMSHATPGADRKSGFLIPKYKSDDIFGTTVKTPYYYNIAPNKDAVITPTFTTEEGVVLDARYNHLLKSGKYYLEASITNPDEVDNAGNKIGDSKIRGHIEGKGEFSINPTWTWGFDAKRSTDDTYLRKYDYGEEDVLTSKLYVTNISGRSSVNIETISFQGLNVDDDAGETPLILPNANMHYESDKGQYSERWVADFNALSLKRDEGVSSNRLSAKGGIKTSKVTKSGSVFELYTTIRTDAYHVDNVPNGADTLNGGEVRFIPEVELKWSLPAVKNTPNRSFFIEPLAQLIVSPYGGNPDKIPNEDSQDIEFSDENLFNSNRFSGLDRIESGPRVNYGIRSRISDDKYGDVDILFGQNYRTKVDNNFSAQSGLDDYFSDYVGRVGYQANEMLEFSYRFRIDKDNFTFNKTAVGAELDLSPIQLNLDYVSIGEAFDATSSAVSGDNRETIIASGVFDINEKWQLSGEGNRNLEDGDWVSTKANLLYKGDCVDIGLSWFREFTRDRDIVPNTTLSLQVSLKNLGY